MEIVKCVQREKYTEECERLSQDLSVKKTSALYKLGVFMEAGLMRVGGRLTRADLSYEVKHPAVLPAVHPVTELITRDQHEKLGHMGVPTVLGKIRENYWIVRGYSSVRRVLQKRTGRTAEDG